MGERKLFHIHYDVGLSLIRHDKFVIRYKQRRRKERLSTARIAWVR